MANVNAPFGFRPTGKTSGPPNFGTTELRIAYNNAHNIFRGDWVIQLSTGYIDVGAAGDGAIGAGVFWGCEYYNTQLKVPFFSPWWIANAPVPTNGVVKALVIQDPDVMFEVQSNGTDNPIGFSSIGKNIDIATGNAGNQFNGISGMTVDDNTIATTNTLPFHLQALWDGTGTFATNAPPGVNGSDYTTLYNVVVVTINAAVLRAGQTGV